jgi:malonyl-CoA O-methyltransferase
MTMAPMPGAVFSAQVRRRFEQHAPHYDGQATLQRAVAWRLAHLIRALPLPDGPRADLGAGTGLLGQALRQQAAAAGRAHAEAAAAAPLLQLDLCAELLRRNPLSWQRQWDLEQGLPPELAGAALLCSSFALQWLPQPARQLRHWCETLQPGGWLVLAVPTAGSFPEWHAAAARAGVPCTALPLPPAEGLIAATAPLLTLHRQQRLRFRRCYGSGRGFLGRLSRLGAGTSPAPRLSAGQLRRLLQAWAGDGRVSWEVLLLVGRKGGRHDPG